MKKIISLLLLIPFVCSAQSVFEDGGADEGIRPTPLTYGYKSEKTVTNKETKNKYPRFGVGLTYRPPGYIFYKNKMEVFEYPNTWKVKHGQNIGVDLSCMTNEKIGFGLSLLHYTGTYEGRREFNGPGPSPYLLKNDLNLYAVSIRYSFIYQTGFTRRFGFSMVAGCGTKVFWGNSGSCEKYEEGVLTETGDYFTKYKESKYNRLELFLIPRIGYKLTDHLSVFTGLSMECARFDTKRDKPINDQHDHNSLFEGMQYKFEIGIPISITYQF